MQEVDLRLIEYYGRRLWVRYVQLYTKDEKLKSQLPLNVLSKPS